MDKVAQEIEDFEREIRKQIDAQLATGKPRVFLSTIGGNLGKDFISNLEQASGMKLAHFIQSHLEYPIGTTGEHNNVFFVVAPGGSTDVEELTTPRFAPSFWKAFAKPLLPDEARFINLATLRFDSDRDNLGNPSDDVREIGSEFVSSDENSRNPSHVTALINAWLEQQQLEPARFYVSRRKQQASQKGLLDEIIGRLTPEQLKRTSMPLDVIKALIG